MPTPSLSYVLIHDGEGGGALLPPAAGRRVASRRAEALRRVSRRQELRATLTAMAQAVRIDSPSDFRLVGGSERSQAAEMTLPPGDSTGGADNRHPDTDQWLYVISGTGAAVVEGEEYELTPRTLLLIEAGEAHEIRSGEEEPLATLNIYAPPEY